MKYDPIKRTLGNLFNRSPRLRILFYRLLDTLLLRTWHVKKAIQYPASSILDAGSGFGQYTWFLAQMMPGASITALDVKEEQIDDCNRFFRKMGKNQVTFEVADLVAFSRPGSFDMILSVDVMEHILEDEQVFRNFATSLKPGGMLLISTPSDQGGSDVHDHGEEHSFIDEHVRDGYNINEIQEKLKRAGFARTDARYTYGKPGQLGWKLSMKYPILMLNTSKLFFILLPFYYLLTLPVALVCNWLDVRMTHPSGTGLLVKAWKQPET